MAAKNISELNLDDFVRIQGPDKGSSRDGSRVTVGRAGDRDSCVKLVDGKLQVTGDDEFRRTVEAAYEAKKTPSSGFGHSPRPAPKPEPEPTVSKLMPATQGPELRVFDVGYYWNEYHQSKEAIYKKLYGPETNFQQQSLFERNNEHLQDMVLPGEIVILANNPQTLAEKDRLILLKTQAKAASGALQKLTPEEASTLKQHFDVFDWVAAHDLSTTSATFGAISTTASKKLEQVQNVLKELNTLYVVHVSSSKGKPFPPEFYLQRQILFSKLDGHLSKLAVSGISISDYSTLKRRLGLSTKSVLHNWRTVSRHGEVPALGERIAHMSKFVAGANRIGYVSIGLDAATGLTKIHHACTEGTQCQKTTAREIGRFSGAVGGGIWGAEVGGSIAIGAASGVAIAFGVVLSAPVIAVIGIGGAVAGGYYAGDKFSEMGAQVGEIISDTADKGAEKAMDVLYKMKGGF
ncbi:hypothetical protein [Aeromonas salmonicida]|uniref:hypothetical protein n=1 Tax=Aeromonas salmonicida TaxID=645 RepID=UPI0023308656|nr:hypothetical protein [Aeromonas salmonicida]WCH28719.1 hypothetical protein ONZ66_07965 [Aeromonas salmonicida]